MGKKRIAVLVKVEIPRYIEANTLADALMMAEDKVERALDAAFLSPRSVEAVPMPDQS